jgi:Rod binding domain-containing protein
LNEIQGVGVPVAKPAPGSPQAKLLAAAHELESVFYGQLFKAMRDTVPEGGIVTKSTGEQMFTGMLDDEISRLATGQTDRGLATALYHELSRQLPANSAASPSPVALPELSNAAAHQD